MSKIRIRFIVSSHTRTAAPGIVEVVVQSIELPKWEDALHYAKDCSSSFVEFVSISVTSGLTFIPLARMQRVEVLSRVDEHGWHGYPDLSCSWIASPQQVADAIAQVSRECCVWRRSENGHPIVFSRHGHDFDDALVACYQANQEESSKSWKCSWI